MQYWQSGQQLDGSRYRIDKVLGGGGFGVTYLATDRKRDRPVAIKTLNPLKYLEDPQHFQQQQVKFVNEKVSHTPYVVQLES